MADGEGAASRSVAVDRSEKAGGVTRVVLLTVTFIAVLLALIVVAREQAEPLILGLLALLAVIGVFSLFAGAIGIMHFGSSAVARNDLTKLISDDAPDGLVVTDKDGRIVYANNAYLTLTGAMGEQDVCGRCRVEIIADELESRDRFHAAADEAQPDYFP